MKALEYAVLLSPLRKTRAVVLSRRFPPAGCMSDGETPEEALANVQDAIDCWIEAAIDHGRAVPSPTIAHERRAFG